MNAFIIALRELAGGFDTIVRRAEPWGIMLAVIALGVSIVQYNEERDERRETRQFLAEEREARAWERLLATGTAEGGRSAALNYLSAQGTVFKSLDLSCDRNEGRASGSPGRKCTRPVQLVNLNAASLSFQGANLSGVEIGCYLDPDKPLHRCNNVEYFGALSSNLNNMKILFYNGISFNIYDSTMSGFSFEASNVRYAHFDSVSMVNAMLSFGRSRERRKVVIRRSNISGLNYGGRWVNYDEPTDDDQIEIARSWYWEDSPPRFDTINVNFDEVFVCSRTPTPPGWEPWEMPRRGCRPR